MHSLISLRNELRIEGYSKGKNSACICSAMAMSPAKKNNFFTGLNQSSGCITPTFASVTQRRIGACKTAQTNKDN